MARVKRPRPIAIAVVSDLHCGSTIGLHPAAPTPQDDGGVWHPSEAQLWLWEQWVGFWRFAAEHAEGRDLTVVVNGDAVDGDHHNTAQIISRHPGIQMDVLLSSMKVPLALKPKHVVVVRGTESHVGKSGATEEAAARAMAGAGVPIVRCPSTGTASWWHFLGDFGRLRLSATHHGRMGQRSWTKGSVTSAHAADIFHQYAARGERWPDLAVRSHYHRHSDSGDMQPVRVVQTPAYQLATAFVHRVAPDSLADIGGLVVTVDDAEWKVQKWIAKPTVAPVWRAPHE